MKKTLLALALVLVMLPAVSAQAATHHIPKHLTRAQEAHFLFEQKYLGSEMLGFVCHTNAKFISPCK